MRPSRMLALALSAALLSGCTIGGNFEKFPPALSPAGAKAQVRTAGGNTRAELLAASDTGLVLLADSKVVLAPYASVLSIRLSEYSAGYYTSGKRPNEKTMTYLRLVSRFPQGISPDLLAKLLALHDQQAPGTIQ